MDKYIVVHPYQEVVFSNTKDLLIYATTWVNLRTVVVSEIKQN